MLQSSNQILEETRLIAPALYVLWEIGVLISLDFMKYCQNNHALHGDERLISTHRAPLRKRTQDIPLWALHVKTQYCDYARLKVWQ